MPVLGRNADVKTVSGTVLVRLPGNHAFVPLSPSTKIPFGTAINATHGRVKITTEGPHGTTQTVTLSEGEFVLTQARNAMVVATLAGGNFSGVPDGSGAGARRPRRIQARDGKTRRAQTVGRRPWQLHDRRQLRLGVRARHPWLTEDLCEGTLIHVATDRVAVINRVNHRHVIVKAGHSYLAKAP